MRYSSLEPSARYSTSHASRLEIGGDPTCSFNFSMGQAVGAFLRGSPNSELNARSMSEGSRPDTKQLKDSRRLTA